MTRRAERVVVAMDKFRASASAGALAASITKRGAQEVIFDVVVLSDGGEGFRAAFDGEVVPRLQQDAVAA